ncbi:RCC1 domain-containing protein 1 [Caenorhabditis elegans]|uniref:RCC1 domain-containing protein 1 n=2 Tax=Caenorhabditis elegans TaxID=6239 RepID=A0A0K3AU54_CAEEL|nr:RCC1 domain-containing protein 1 [Caenorhabditis elegans]CTQ86340.1 RCC1 domain-containing protein 1 [Caenorhabditis elegans]|eukprot:NP_001300401.1 Uncharacterized protein CELE_K11D2.1 [Caenorhabditis elegans]
MYRMIPTWFGSISVDSCKITLIFDAPMTSLASETIQLPDEVKHVACTHLHMAILMKHEKLAVRRLDDFEGNLTFLDLHTDLDVLLVATSREIYAVERSGTSSEIVKILVDSVGISPKKNNLANKIQFPWPVRIVEAAAGHDFLIFRDTTGNLFSMGTGTRGELGVGLIRRVDEPVHIEQLVGIRIKKVACGGWHTVALTEGGDAYTWGWNRYGQLGKDKGSTEVYPVLIDPEEEKFGEENILDVACTEHNTQIVIKTGHAPFVLGTNPTPPINEFHLD